MQPQKVKFKSVQKNLKQVLVCLFATTMTFIDKNKI